MQPVKHTQVGPAKNYLIAGVDRILILNALMPAAKDTVFTVQVFYPQAFLTLVPDDRVMR